MAEKTEEELMAEWDAAATQSETEQKVLSQDEIDSLLGGGQSAAKTALPGIKQLLEKAMLSYEKMPMLEIIFERFVRSLSTNLRNFVNENVDVDIKSIKPLRFGDYVNTVPIPSMIVIFKVIEWKNYGMMVIEGNLIYLVMDMLFGGKKISKPAKLTGRPYTIIEQNIVCQFAELIFADLGIAFDQISTATFELDRLETNPRFATIAKYGEAAILSKIHIDFDNKGGDIEILIPYSTIEPIKSMLTQVFMGEKPGKDNIWEEHFSQELLNTVVDLKAVVDNKEVSFSEAKNLKVGSTIIMNKYYDDDITVKCDDIDLYLAKLGKKGETVALHINDIINDKLKGYK